MSQRCVATKGPRDFDPMLTRFPFLYLTYSTEDRLHASESDVCRRQILTYKDGPLAERIKYLYWS